MTNIRRNCKFCNSEIEMSNRDGWWYPYELTGDLHNCLRRRNRN
jgi:hypothetical protein